MLDDLATSVAGGGPKSVTRGKLVKRPIILAFLLTFSLFVFVVSFCVREQILMM